MRVEADGWGPGPNILSEESLTRVRAALEETPVIVEHRLYRGSSAPQRHVFDDPDECEAYLRTRTRPGDAIYVWRYDALCRDDNTFTQGKIPDADGAVPARGAY